MGDMFVQIKSDSGLTEESGLTLAEQTDVRVYLQDEDKKDSTMKEIGNASIEEVRNCEKIGFINFDAEEVEEIGSEYIAEPMTESVYLGGFAGNESSVSVAEQRGGEVYVEFDDGHTLTITGELDRAYTY